MSNDLVKLNEVAIPESEAESEGPFRGRNIFVERIDCRGGGMHGAETTVTLVAYGEDAGWLQAAAYAIMKKQAGMT